MKSGPLDELETQAFQMGVVMHGLGHPALIIHNPLLSPVFKGRGTTPLTSKFTSLKGDIVNSNGAFRFMSEQKFKVFVNQIRSKSDVNQNSYNARQYFELGLSLMTNQLMSPEVSTDYITTNWPTSVCGECKTQNVYFG